jgi:beta-lactamase superfamily II metal-dependent hydrolase
MKGNIMTIQYISTKSTVFHPDPQTDSQEFVLIFGDEIDTTGQQENGRDEVIYRGRTGWVRSDRLMPDHPLEIYCIDVGQGDSVFVVTPNGRKILVDGGQGNEAFQFLVWKYRLDQTNPNPIDIDLMVVSHADDDHIAGLIAIIQHPLIRVREIIHSGIAKYSSGFTTNLGDTVGQGQNRVLVTRHDSAADLANQQLNTTMTNWRTAIVNEQGLTYRAVDSTTGQVDVGDQSVTLNVLGPRLVPAPGNNGPGYRWMGSSSNTINGNSVVLRLDYNNVRILLPGDLNERGARHLMDAPAFQGQIDAHVLKAPHHGSRHFDLDFLVAVHPQITVISSGESPDHGHPRANFIGAVGKVSRSREPLIFSTELVAQFAVDSDAEAPDADDEVDPIHASMLGQARRRFKKRLNGIINIRTDGTDLYCARRVAAGYQFVTYELAAAHRDP